MQLKKVNAIIRTDKLEDVEGPKKSLGHYRGAHTSTKGDGIIVMMPVEKVFRIRTKAEAGRKRSSWEEVHREVYEKEVCHEKEFWIHNQERGSSHARGAVWIC